MKGLMIWVNPQENPIKGPGMVEGLRAGLSPGYHTIQRRRGCYVVPGGHFSHGFVELTFNNHDYIMLNEDLETWSVVGKAAEMIRQDFEEENFAKYMREYLRGPCVEGILGLLQYGEKALLRAGKYRNCPTFPEMKLLSHEDSSSAGSSWTTNPYKTRLYEH